tara:strand:- start:59 stop:319 length:261 start_codon:yes stop_codon:yes gene_type:complete
MYNARKFTYVILRSFLHRFENWRCYFLARMGEEDVMEFQFFVVDAQNVGPPCDDAFQSNSEIIQDAPALKKARIVGTAHYGQKTCA